MRIKDIMTTQVESCTVDTALPQVAKLMWTAGCGAIPVIDSHGRVSGMITDRDISMALVHTGRKPNSITAREAMSQHVHVCGPEDQLTTALENMKRYKVRRLPIVSDDGQLRGILSIDDIILRALAPDAPTSGEIVNALREILQYRTITSEPELVS